MIPKHTYYELLGVEPAATPEEIKAAFRSQAIRTHPDQGGSPVLFRMLEEAYEVLINPARRAEYDSSLEAEASAPVAVGAGGPVVNNEASSAGSRAHTRRDSYWQEEQPTNAGQPAEDFWAAAPDPDEPATSPGPSGSILWDGTNSDVDNGRIEPIWKRGLRSAREGISIKFVVLVALLLYGVFSVLSHRQPITGDLATLIVPAVIIWIFGSLLLRLAGWAVGLWAVISAYALGAPASHCAVLMLVAFGLWLAGQWLYTLRKGQWRSAIAAAVLTKLPGPLRPDYHWSRMS